MPIARFQLPDGRIARFEVPDGTSPEAAQQMMEAQLPSLLEKKPQTTLGGNVKELFKGIPAGGVNLLETAFTGAAAMLPEKAEEGARITAKEMADAARKPFEAAKGYEDTVGRKLGEGVGSTLPFFLLGPAGTAGRVAGAGLGIAAGAGEARQEAEAKGEKGDARMWSTLLGAPVGALDLVAPEIKAGKSMIVNALKRGGMEGATEAAQKVAQNLIAKGLYDPERSTLGGAGEEGAYGAGTGALISFLLDATLGKAGRGVNIQPTKPGQPTPDEAAQQARREALAKEQMDVAAGKEARAGEKLLNQEEKLAAKEEDLARADRLAAMDQLNAQVRAQREEELKAAFPADYSDVMQRTDAYAELSKELDSLGKSKTKEANARREQLKTLLWQMGEEDARVPAEFARVQREQEKLAKAAGFPAKKSAAGFLTANPQMEMREAMLEPGQELPPQYDLKGNLIEPEVPVAEPTKRFPTFKTAKDALRGQKRAETAAAKEAEALRLEQEAAGQMGFDFGRRSKKPLAQPSIEPEVAATTTEEKAPVPEPTLVKKPAPATPDQLPTVVTPDVLGSLGIGRTATIRKADHGIMNKDISDPAQAAEVKSILEAYRSRPNLSPAIAEKVDAYLARPEFKAAAPAATATQGETNVGPIEQEGRGAGLPAPEQTDTGATAPTVAEPERVGMVPAGPDVGTDIGREGEPAAPVAEQLAKYEDLRGSTREGAIRGEIAMNNKVLALAQERGEAALVDKLTRENARLEALLPEAQARDDRDRRGSIDRQILGQAKSELDTAVANGDLTQDQADKLVEDARQTGNVAGASEKILEGVDETEPKKLTGMFDQLTSAPKTTPEGNTVYQTVPTAKGIDAFMEELYSKKHPFDLPKGNPLGLGEAPESRGAEATTGVQAALQEKAKAGDVRGALQAILDAPDGVYNELDKLVAKRLLAAGSLPTLEVVPSIESGADGTYNAVDDHVTLAEGSVGSHTLLHELVHGFVHRIIGLHEGGVSKNMHVANLRQLYDHIAKQRPDLMQTYGMTNLSEFASEVMSNKEFQKQLQKLAYRRENAFTAFAKAVLRILGISPTDTNTALGSALISVEAVMGEGRRLQEAAKGTAVEGSLPGVANVAVGITPSDVEEVKRISSSFGPDAAPTVNGLINDGFRAMNRATENGGMFQAFRQAAVDKYASVEAKISNMFSKGVRDAFGNLNPMVLVRQAEDHAKVFMSYISDGGIRFNKEGLVETYKQDASAVKALTQLKKLADKSNMSFDAAKTYVSSVLEGHRAHDIHENHNKLLEASALTLEGQGKNKEADAERAKKIDLHLTLAQIATLEAQYQKSPEIQAIQDTFNKTRGTAIDLMVQSGRLSKEQGDDWKANSAYVPFDRVMEVMGENPMPRGKGLGVMTATPKIKGSLDKRVKDVIDSYMGTLGWMTEEAMRHNASSKLLNEMTTAGFAEKLPTPNAATNKNLVVRLYEDGKPVHYQVQNEYDMLAFQQAPEINNWLVKGLAATSRALRVSVTAMPPFAVKQVVEDATRAAMYSGVQRPLVVAMKTLYNMPKVFFGEVFGHKSVAAKRMEALGIVGDYDFNIYQPTLEIEKEIGALKRGVAGTIFHTLEKFTKASDMAARLAVYEETMRESGGDEVLAQTRARELINFNRRGASSSMRLATRVIPFFNAYAQGMDVLYRAASGIDSSSSVDRASARKMFMSRVAMMTAMGFAYALAMSDDDGYKKATDDVRDSNWLLPNGFKIPTAKELGFIYKVIPERVVEYMRRAGGPEEQSAMDALAGIVKAGYSAYSSPTAVPSYVRPILENMTNYSFFLQRELESASMQAKVPGQRYNSSTSEFAKALGDATNTSPIKIDNLLKGMFGMAGSTTLLATDALLNPTRPDRPLYQMPFGSIFLYDTEGGRNKSEFYDLRERSAQAVTTFEDLRLKDPTKAEKFMEENQGLIAVAPKLNSTLEQLSTLRRMRLMVEQGTEEQLGVDSAERRRMLDELKGYENEVTSEIRMIEKAVREVQ